MKHIPYLILISVVIFIYFLGTQNKIKNIDNYLDYKEYSANWLTDFSSAKAKAEDEEKPILINFTGSNWCAGCIRLDKEIFSKPVFITYANEHLILLKVDFPMGVQQEESLVNQNNFLYDLYDIEGLPTVVLVGSEGEIYRDTGYGSEDPRNYVTNLKSLLIEID